MPGLRSMAVHGIVVVLFLRESWGWCGNVMCGHGWSSTRAKGIGDSDSLILVGVDAGRVDMQRPSIREAMRNFYSL